MANLIILEGLSRTGKSTITKVLSEKYGFKNHVRFSGLTPDKIVPPVENNWYGFGCGMSHVSILETYKDIPLFVVEFITWDQTDKIFDIFYSKSNGNCLVKDDDSMNGYYVMHNK